MNNRTDTIVAPATPPGRGGVGVVRVSGPAVKFIMQSILGKKLSARRVVFCDFLAEDKNVIDKGLAIYFSAPNSFTGEEVLELQGHGGPVVMDLILQRVLELGARFARPGEFMQRAFLNNKIDLIQAEATADLINASSSQAAQNALRSLRGDFSNKINELSKLLVALRINIEAIIDFVEEAEIEKIKIDASAQEIDRLLLQIRQISKIAKQGMILRDGITLVITGNPNVGKSSLLNCLSGQDMAIVTDIPGTTRDVIRTWIQIDGLSVHLLDTAGLRENSDLIEAEGIRRAWDEIKRADHILLMVDATLDNRRSPLEVGKNFLTEIPTHSKLTVVYNKIDLTGDAARVVKREDIDCIYISTKTGSGIDLLKNHIKSSVGYHALEDGFSARRRHIDALMRADQYLQDSKQNLLDEHKFELVAEDLHQAQNALGEITGELTADDLLGKIFSEFCVGK